MHCFFIIFLIPSGWILKLLMHICLAIWALMNCVDMAHDQLEANPNTPGLAVFKGLVDHLAVSKVEMTLFKNRLELLIGILSFPFVFISQAAMILPILYF